VTSPDVLRAERALHDLAEAAAAALERYNAGHFDAAQLEIARCRRCMRTLDEIRREQEAGLTDAW
jgi:hypothetical protein